MKNREVQREQITEQEVKLVCQKGSYFDNHGLRQMVYFFQTPLFIQLSLLLYFVI